MVQQTSLQETPKSTGGYNSDNYDVNEVCKALDEISPWENCDEFTKELMEWADHQYFEQSEFQNKHFVINSHVTPYRQMQQAAMEVQVRYNSLQKITISYKRCLNDIARVTHEMEQEEDPFYKQDKVYELQLLQVDKTVWVNKINQSKKEIESFVKIIKEKFQDPSDIKGLLEDKELKEREEQKYWIARMARQSATDLMTTGRIQAGNIEALLQMNPEDQAAVVDLALTYSTAVNRSIGGIKTAAEDRVDKMMEGKPPQLFDTNGVLTDYATQNIADRLLQSADQSEGGSSISGRITDSISKPASSLNN
jgi:hypothetical protein